MALGSGEGNEQAADRGLLRFSTAGSVDDGKSSLIGRMLYDAKAVPHDRIAALERLARRRGESEIDLSLLMDGLTIEREQGITIDVAYSYFATARRKFIIADTPGHEQYTRNMVTGASTADAAVILVDARRGMSVQTRRHLYLSHLLRVPHLIVAVNKMDLVGYGREAYDKAARAAVDFSAAIGAPQPHLVPISAKRGDNVVARSAHMKWYRGEALLALLESLPPALCLLHAPLRFPVQLVQRVAFPDGGQTRRYLGCIESGALRLGDEIAVMPSGKTTRIRALARFDGPLQRAESGMSVAVEVQDDLDIARGDMLAPPLMPPRVAKDLAATLCWFSEEPFTGSGRYLIKGGTRSIAARITALEHRVDIVTLSTEPNPDALRCNDIARVRIRLAQPLAFDAYDDNRATGSFILIDEDTNATVAAGMIARTEDDPPPSAAAGFDAGL
jgi:sulfate adenylyltransferase subunit 1